MFILHFNDWQTYCMTLRNFDGLQPRSQTISRSIRKAPLDALWRMGQSDRPDQEARDANEWYWVNRFGHSLVDSYSFGLIGQTTYYAGPLTEEEIDLLTPDDLAVLACSASVRARRIAAREAATPSSSLERLAFDSEPDVRRAAGHNPATPAAVILRMASRNSPAEENREISEHRLEFLWAEIASVPLDRELALKVADGYYTDLYGVALIRRKSVPVDVLARLAAGYSLPREAAIELANNNHIRVRSSLASNPSDKIPPEVLVGLAEDAVPDVRVAVAKNRNLPHKVLLRLLDDESAQVRHAVIVHGHLSDDVLQRLDGADESRRSLQERLRSNKWSGYWRRPDGEESPLAPLLRKLAGSPHALTRAAVAQNPGTPIGVLEELAGDTEEDVIRAISYGLGYDTANRFFDGGYDLTTIWWSRRRLSGTELSSLLNSPVALLRALGAARHDRRLQDAPRELSRLAQDTDPTVRAAVATNPLASFEDVVELASDANETVQQAASSSLIDWLKTEQEPYVPREKRDDFQNNWLARMESVPDGIPQMFDRPDWDRLSIDRLPAGGQWFLTDEELERMAKSGSIAVRAAVASYSGPHESRSFLGAHLTTKVLALLLRDQDSTVREGALRNTGAAAVSLAASSVAPAEALLHYAHSSNPDLRRAVAANSLTPGPILANIVRDREVSVRAAVAANIATPLEALVVLAGDQSEEVLLGLLDNENVPQAILEQQAERPADLGEYKRHTRLARNASSPASILARIAYSRWVDIRGLVARNPNTSVDTLETLALDEHPSVRAAVESRLQRD